MKHNTHQVFTTFTQIFTLSSSYQTHSLTHASYFHIIKPLLILILHHLLHLSPFHLSLSPFLPPWPPTLRIQLPPFTSFSSPTHTLAREKKVHPRLSWFTGQLLPPFPPFFPPYPSSLFPPSPLLYFSSSLLLLFPPSLSLPFGSVWPRRERSK